jgi:hypothetical protein
MSSVLEVLDRFPKDQDEEEKRRWRGELERSLATAAGEWVSAVGPPGSQTLGTDRAWVLLSWVEGAASEVVRSRRGGLVETAAFAMSLLEASPLDRRDVLVVAMLVRRASSIAGLPFGTLVGRGCERAGALGAPCCEWLLRVIDATPSTHEESGTGASFAFGRKPSTLDAAALERWLTTGSQPRPPQSRGRTLPRREEASVTSGRGRSGPAQGHRDGEPPEADDGRVWPGWLRYPVIAVLGAVAMIGLITVLYDGGWLPLAGPFVATVVVSTLVFLVAYRRGRRVRRLSADAVHQLRTVAPAIARERALAPEARSTRASDQSLTHAAEQVELALQRFAWGHDQAAIPFVDDLAATARDSWLPGAPLSQTVDRLARTTSKLDALVHKMLAVAKRRPR